MRIVGVAILFAMVSSANAGGDYWHPIDLNRPGAFETLKTENPGHFEAVAEVLRAAEHMPCMNNDAD